MADLIRGFDRVRDLGEVFTPDWMVELMLDELPPEVWADPDATFLEPSCGDGAFLVAVTRRKLARIAATSDPVWWAREACRTLSTIYGVDISPANIEWTPEYGPGARDRVVREVTLAAASDPDRAAAFAAALPVAAWIVSHNIRVGNMLWDPETGGGEWQTLPLWQYRWDGDHVTVTLTTYGAAYERAQQHATGQFRLLTFGDEQVVYDGHWAGMRRLP